MTQNEKQKLISVYNALNLIEVKGVNNLNNLAGSINIVAELLSANDSNTNDDEAKSQ